MLRNEIVHERETEADGGLAGGGAGAEPAEAPEL